MPGSIQTRGYGSRKRDCSAQSVSGVCTQTRPKTGTWNSSKTQQLETGRRWPLSSTKSSHASWSLEKAVQSAPRVPWSASGFARGLRGWILDNVTAIHSVEFSAFHPAGFAGAADGLLDIQGSGSFCSVIGKPRMPNPFISPMSLSCTTTATNSVPIL